MLKKAIGAALTGYALLLAQPAGAVTHIISLTADPVNLMTGAFTFGGSNFRTGNLVVDTFDPFTISEGDIIRTTLTLASGLTVPASIEQFFGLNFFQGNNGSPPGYMNNEGPMTNGTLTFSYSMGPTGLPNDVQPGNCTNCLTAIGGQTPGAEFTFDGLFVDQTITSLNAPFTIDGASFSYQLRDVAPGVPEPESWALMIVGMFAVAGAMRRRTRLTIVGRRAAIA